MVFTAADIATLIVQVGLPLATQLMQDIENKVSYSPAQFLALIPKYGTKTADSYLADAGGAPVSNQPAVMPITTP